MSKVEIYQGWCKKCGICITFCPLISRRSLARVIARRLPSSKVEVNLLAFDEALRVARGLNSSLKSAETKDEFDI
jgi:ferredoxin